MGIQITYEEGLEYAAGEWQYFADKYRIADGNWKVVLKTDSALPRADYNIEGDGCTMTVTGSDASAVLCGVYDALRTCGVNFTCLYDFAGSDIGNPMTICRHVHPKVKRRGIRQHINFPMDISAWGIPEAQNYIRCLARSGFNAITFHSYHDQWHAGVPGKSYAGHFFYGEVHHEEDGKVWCMPEALDVFDDEKKRHDVAVNWLQTMIRTAKECYMEVTLSVELHSDSRDVNNAMLKQVCADYSDIDILELISVESDRSCSVNLTKENAAEVLSSILGEKVLIDGRVPEMDFFDDEVPCFFTSTCEFIGRALKALEDKAEWGGDKLPGLRVSIYLTITSALKGVYPILKRVLPEGVTQGYLSEYGSMGVADSLKGINMLEEDLEDTMIYSWAEFDGNMFLRQAATAGLERLFGDYKCDMYGVCVNHWRTSENLLTIGYLARAAVCPLSSEEYYRDAARAFGIDDPDKFASLFKQFEELDTFCGRNLFNVGFCYYGSWAAGDSLGMVHGYTEENLVKAIDGYNALRDAAASLTASTPEGADYLNRLKVQLHTSVLHLTVINLMRGIWSYFKDDRYKSLTKEEYDLCHSVLTEADSLAHQYADEYLTVVGDRGCLGLVISYRNVIHRYIGNWWKYLDKAELKTETEFDAPPVPERE